MIADTNLVNAARTVRERLDRPGWPGAAFAIMRGTDIVLRDAFGLASVELGTPLSAATVMTVASVTKQFTCLALHMLAKEGRIDLDGEALPGITYRHLMHNASGLPEIMETYALGGGDLSAPAPRAALLDLVRRQSARNFKAGTDFAYCNTNFAYLHDAAERIEGRPFAEILRDRILGPAGMKTAILGTRQDEVIPGLGNGYLVRDGKLRRAVDAWPGGGEGGLRASLDDMIEWARNWSTKNVGGELLDAICMRRPFANGRPNFYASGVQVAPWRGLDTVGHGGLMPGFLTEFIRVPAEDLTVIVIANSDRFQPWLVAREILDRARGLDPDAIRLKAESIIPGTYLSEDGGLSLDLLAQDGYAFVRQHGATFGLDAEGNALRGGFAFRWDGSGVIGANGDRIAYRRIDPAGALPKGLDGVWRHAELGAAYMIDGAALRIDGPLRGGVWADLEPLAGASFRIRARDGWYPRVFDAKLRDDGALLVNAGRSRGFAFRQ